MFSKKAEAPPAVSYAFELQPRVCPNRTLAFDPNRQVVQPLQ